MCLAVPGKILSRRDLDAVVDFHGSRVEVSLVLVPEARVGAWVLVHAGFALLELDAEEAAETWKYLAAAEVADELTPAGPAGPE